jgi:hypothetical protein
MRFFVVDEVFLDFNDDEEEEGLLTNRKMLG